MLFCKNERQPNRNVGGHLAELTCPPESVIVSGMSTAVSYGHGVVLRIWHYSRCHQTEWEYWDNHRAALLQ